MSEDDIQVPKGSGLTRRGFLADGATAVAATAIARQLTGGRAIPRPQRLPEMHQARASQLEAMRVLGKTRMRMPDSLPNAAIAAGTDTLPQIEHVVVLMMENHSYDNFFGMLGRGPYQQPRGDGYTIGADGYPTAINPAPTGQQLRAFRMPTTCQLSGKPTQDWQQSHIQYAKGANSGFVVSGSGPVAMGYWQQQDLPFTYDLASNFPIGDRWFCSVLGQTDPNRRFLIAATSSGMTDDIGSAPNNASQNATLTAKPKNGTIFSSLTEAGISWREYAATYPDFTGLTMNLYPSVDASYNETNGKPLTQFFTDAAAGKLPSFSFLDPNYSVSSQENPQNIVLGDALLSQVVKALGASPQWLKTMLIITYDEHGGYYDHVPPPKALAPDSTAPVLEPGEAAYDGFTRYGFRVPSVIVSPYAKRNYVSHMVYDHTSILAFVERKWNLRALTLRDANANDLLDFLDVDAMAKGQPTFPEMPKLAASGDTTASMACSTSGPGTIPPPRPKAMPIKLALKYSGPSHKQHGVVIELQTNHSQLQHLLVELHQGHKQVAKVKVGLVTTALHKVVLREKGKLPAAGHYTITVTHGHKTLAKHKIHVG